MAAEPEAVSIERLLTAATEAMAKARYCWAVTPGETGQAHARPMGAIPGAPGDDASILWFLTHRDSRKALEIGRAARLTVVFQHEADDSYVTLSGRSEIITDRGVIRARWRKDWTLIFPGGSEDENAVLVRTEAERLELWLRGVTPEPFGLRATVLERDEARRWRQAS